MRIAVEGCAHGELEIIYNALEEVERNDGKKIDLLICCGDFQATRNLDDLKSMAVPDKYKDMCTFYKYYSGEKVAPYLTIFIGGNHEASNYHQELSYGGWVAPNIFYMGYASVVRIGGLRIAGISGIYKSQHYLTGHFELPPYDEHTLRSVYHIRNLEVFRLKQLSGNIDIFLSHDWPNGVTKYGDVERLLKRKFHFKADIANDALGSAPCMELLTHHYPSYWFSAHLHCKFAALIPNADNTKVTKFLALDKCLVKRPFLQVLEIPHDKSAPMKLSYDLEWLTVLYLTNHLLSVKNQVQYMPGPGCNGRFTFTPTDSEKATVMKKFQDCLTIPENFVKTVEAYSPQSPSCANRQVKFGVNQQTTDFCDKLGIDDPLLLQFLRANVVVDQKDESYSDLLSEESIHDSTSDFLSESYQSLTDSQDVENNCEEDLSLDDSFNVSGFSTLMNSSGEGKSFESQEVPQNEGEKVEPNTKKFKRRNLAIYADTSETDL